MSRLWSAIRDKWDDLRPRWLPVALVALIIFVISAAARLITWKGGFAKESQQERIGYVVVTAVALVLLVAAVRWSIRYPLGRMVADLGAATLIACVLHLLIGPFFGGSRPFKEGLAFFVGQLLLFLGIALVGAGLGYLGVVAAGRDWKSRGLRQYEKNYRAKPPRIVRS